MHIHRRPGASPRTWPQQRFDTPPCHASRQPPSCLCTSLPRPSTTPGRDAVPPLGSPGTPPLRAAWGPHNQNCCHDESLNGCSPGCASSTVAPSLVHGSIPIWRPDSTLTSTANWPRTKSFSERTTCLTVNRAVTKDELARFQARRACACGSCARTFPVCLGHELSPRWPMLGAGISAGG